MLKGVILAGQPLMELFREGKRITECGYTFSVPPFTQCAVDSYRFLRLEPRVLVIFPPPADLGIFFVLGAACLQLQIMSQELRHV